MKKYKIFLITTGTIICLSIVLSCKKNNLNNNENNSTMIIPTSDSVTNTKNLENKKSLKDEFKNHNPSNSDLGLNDINNITKLNGFKNIKLGSDISIYDFENYSKKNAYITNKYSEIYDYFNDKEIRVGNGYVACTELEYIDNKLVYIELTHFEKIQNIFNINLNQFVADYRAHSLINLYTRIFGKPTKTMLFDNGSYFTYPYKECFLEDYESCFSEFCNLAEKLEMQDAAICFNWKTDSVIYELIVIAKSKFPEGKEEAEKKKECYENGTPYYSSEKSIVRIYSNKPDLLQKLKSLEQESYTIKYEHEKDSKAKTDLNGI